MKRTIAGALVVLLAAGAAVARPQEWMDSYAAREMEAIAEEERGKELASVSIGDLQGWRDRLTAAAGKDAYVARSGGASFMLPGLGQLRNGETGLGALLLGGHFAIGVGGLLGSYFLLPADLRLDSLDYLRSPASAVEAAWKSHSLLDYLPSIGVRVGAHLLDMGLRAVASHNARAIARRRIDSGEVDPSADR